MPLPPHDGTLRVDVPSLFAFRCLTVSALADEITFNVCKLDRSGVSVALHLPAHFPLPHWLRMSLPSRRRFRSRFETGSVARIGAEDAFPTLAGHGSGNLETNTTKPN